ncbi:hypothetical protein [Chamaesiphon sp. GL140_3_metabinner_50]|uniref:hypothetical protein n=1 Tax=Chamaesiphon sp. GL140_3_metabinner_50 TaxID=2970812 RepID=UPI0025DF63D4|nr:hypothetical protein [Chamaesiphon sp. GL140_3_metabinner_50]
MLLLFHSSTQPPDLLEAFTVGIDTANGKTFMAKLALLDAQDRGFATSFIVVTQVASYERSRFGDSLDIYFCY